MFVHTASIRCSPLFSGEVHFCRRKTSNKIITSDHCGFAGVRPPTTRSPPASIRSPELSYPAQICLPMSTPLIGADNHLRADTPLPEVKIPKDHHLRPPRLRRSTVVRHAASSGQHSLTGAGLPAAIPSSDERPAHRSRRSPPVRALPAGGKHPKLSSPPTTAASPEFGHPPHNFLRLTFAPRSWSRGRSLSSDERPDHRS